jgi:hypothetical protein
MEFSGLGTVGLWTRGVACGAFDLQFSLLTAGGKLASNEWDAFAFKIESCGVSALRDDMDRNGLQQTCDTAKAFASGGEACAANADRRQER